MPKADRINQPFEESVAYFRDKVRLPTAAWTDLWEGQHARAFVIAGAMKDDLLTDFQQAIDKTMTSGARYADFRKQFDAIVKKHGWSYNGGAGWRSRVIYETNMQTAYMAGRFKQMDAVSKQRPYWLYQHSHFVVNPRPQHVAWSGLVLRHDDPWWKTHYPPNGWGCKCKVHALNERDMKKRGKTKPDDAPPANTREVTVGKRGPTPRTVKVPDGIDPGFAYNVGEASVGKNLTQEKWREWSAQKRNAWKRLNTDDYLHYNRPDMVPLDSPQSVLGTPITSKRDAETALKALFKGDETVIKTPAMPVYLNAAAMADHLDINRSAYFPYLKETLEDPYEVWLSFEQHKGTGKVELRSRFIKAIQVGKGKAMIVTANVVGGQFVGWTFYPMRKIQELNKDRQGVMVWGRK